MSTTSLPWLHALAAPPASAAEPSHWNPVTITTAILAVAALILSALTFWMNYWRGRTPRPRWVLEWAKAPHDTQLLSHSVRAVARNRGRGPARDVVLRAITVDDANSLSATRADTLAFGEEVNLWFSHEDGADSEAGGFWRGEVYLLDEDTNGTQRFRGTYVRDTMTVELEWSQEPNLHKRRTKQLTYKRR